MLYIVTVWEAQLHIQEAFVRFSALTQLVLIMILMDFSNLSGEIIVYYLKRSATDKLKKPFVSQSD